MKRTSEHNEKISKALMGHPCFNRNYSRVKRTCKKCGSNFDVFPSRVRHGRGSFCSPVCRDGFLLSSNTSIEIKMKSLLNALGIEFSFQHPLEKIACVDFYIPSKKLVIECDGCYWHGCPTHFPERSRKEKDNNRDAKLKILGYKIIRFWEHNIKNMKVLPHSW